MNDMKISILKILWALIVVLFMISCKQEGNKEKDRPYNVLMICVDDLRPELACYGNKVIKSPNIDRLASEGVLFTNHYVQSAICGPSRTSLLTGKISQEWDAWESFRKNGEEPESPVALPHLFKKNGYTTIGIGKITH